MNSERNIIKKLFENKYEELEEKTYTVGDTQYWRRNGQTYKWTSSAGRSECSEDEYNKAVASCNGADAPAKSEPTSAPQEVNKINPDLPPYKELNYRNTRLTTALKSCEDIIDHIVKVCKEDEGKYDSADAEDFKHVFDIVLNYHMDDHLSKSKLNDFNMRMRKKLRGVRPEIIKQIGYEPMSSRELSLWKRYDQERYERGE